MIFTGELKVHFNTRIIAHFRSINLQNLLLNPFKEIREFSMVLVSNCRKISAAFCDKKSRNQTCMSKQHSSVKLSAIPLMGFSRVFSAEAATNNCVHRRIPFCSF